MTVQNSLNKSLPSGVGNLWVGNGTNIPSTSSLTAGSGITIDSVSIPGNIIINHTSTSPFTWNYPISGGGTTLMVANNGYILSSGGSIPTNFTLPAIVNIGDMFAVQNPLPGPTVIFKIFTANSGQFILYNNNNIGSTLTGNIGGTSVFLRCFDNSGLPGSGKFVVLSTNGLPITVI